jgi:hypothetical protein
VFVCLLSCLSACSFVCLFVCVFGRSHSPSRVARRGLLGRLVVLFVPSGNGPALFVWLQVAAADVFDEEARAAAIHRSARGD